MEFPSQRSTPRTRTAGEFSAEDLPSGYDIHSLPWWFAMALIEIDSLANWKMGGSFHGELLVISRWYICQLFWYREGYDDMMKFENAVKLIQSCWCFRCELPFVCFDVFFFRSILVIQYCDFHEGFTWGVQLRLKALQPWWNNPHQLGYNPFSL